jgi:predicted nucleic acid-binding protein
VHQAYLLDASALYRVVKEPSCFSRVLVDAAILDLTLYEVGNAALKMSRRRLLRDYRGFVAAAARLAGLLEIVRVEPQDMSGIAVAAEETGLTFYDAAYVYYARRLRRLLITDDREILRSAPDVALGVEEARRRSGCGPGPA